MASIVLICAFVCVVLYQIHKYMFYKPPNFPPGPPRIPIFGSYLLLLLINYNHLHKAVSKLCRYYKTDILGFYYGPIPTIVASDGASVKEMLYNQAFDGRPNLMLSQLRDPELMSRGIFFTEGPYWKEQRRFALRHLRDYGFGRRFTELELEYNDEINTLIDIIKNGPKYPHEKELVKNDHILCPFIFTIHPGNLFLKLLSNVQMSRKDQHRLLSAAKHTIVFQRKTDAYGLMLSCFPPVIKMFPNWSGYNVVKEASDGINDFAREIIDEQIKTFDENHERSFLDLYIKEMKLAEKNQENTTFFYNQLVLTCVDFFLPSLGAIAVQMAMYMQIIIMKPEIQKKVQDEIDRVVGHGRLPNLDDRINLPYTESSIREILRYHTLAPSAVVHYVLEDTQFMGYDIPKGAVGVPAIHELNSDVKLWKDPENFRPERFLDENGKFSAKNDPSLPFGAGKRLCAGETFSRNSLFLFISAMLQNFTFKAPDYGKIPSIDETMTGLIRTTPDFWIKFVPR